MAKKTLTSPDELLHYQLRTALTMENDSLAALGELRSFARDREVVQLLRHHADETEEQLDRLHQVLDLLDAGRRAAASPATKGISKQAASLIERTAPALRDRVVLSSALGNEHYEIAVYQSLIVPLQAMDADEPVRLLTENLDQENHTSTELQSLLQAMVA